ATVHQTNCSPFSKPSNYPDPLMNKTGDPSDFRGNACCTRHNPLHGKMAELFRPSFLFFAPHSIEPSFDRMGGEKQKKQSRRVVFYC
ncbi:MAG TPA: hypothetical protein VLT36_21490, partial [Candidatus Dormibacteraeota bacterium]|nr:hypothetical protein [Candidatus Dormibacteraeota bacterium]